MLKVNMTEYYCDYCKQNHVRYFPDMEALMAFMAKEYKDNHTQEWRKSFFLGGTTMRLTNIFPAKCGYMGCLRITQISVEGVVIFEEGKYCSPNLAEYLSSHPFGNLITKTYGDVKL